MNEASERSDTPSSVSHDAWQPDGRLKLGSDGGSVPAAQYDDLFEDIKFDENDPNPIGVLKARLDWNVMEDGGWSCQQCTFENERYRVKCTCCGYARNAATPEAVLQGSDSEEEEKQGNSSAGGLPNHLDTVESSSDEETRTRRRRRKKQRSPFQVNPELLKFGTVSGASEPYMPREKSTLNEADERDRRRERVLALRAKELRREKRRAEGNYDTDSQESDDSDHIDWSSEDQASDSDDSDFSVAGVKEKRPKPRTSAAEGKSSGAGASARRASPSTRPASASGVSHSAKPARRRSSSPHRAVGGSARMDVDDADEMADFIEDDVGDQLKDKPRRHRPRRTDADGEAAPRRKKKASTAASEVIRPSSKTAAILRAGGSAFGAIVPPRSNGIRSTAPKEPPAASAPASAGFASSAIFAAAPAQPFITPTLSRPTAPPSAPLLTAPDMTVRLVKLRLPEVVGLSKLTQREYVFRLGQKSDQQTGDDVLTPDLRLSHLLDRVRSRAFAHSGVRLEMEWVCTRAGAKKIPNETQLGELFKHADSSMNEAMEAYQLNLTTLTQLQRVTVHVPPACIGQTPLEKQKILQKVTFHVSQLQVEFLSVEAGTKSIRERYSQLCKVLHQPEHPYLLEALVVGERGREISGVRITRNATHLTPTVLRPLLLALEADAGALRTLVIDTPALDDSNGLLLSRLFTQPLSRQQLSGITEISFSGASMSPAVWQQLLPALSRLPLASLNLSCSTFGDASLPALHNLLRSPCISKSLTSLDLSDCSRLTGGFEEEQVAAALTSSPNAVHFAFDRTPLTAGCLVHLLNYLEGRDGLQTVSLAEMPAMRRLVAVSLRLEEASPPAAVPANENAMNDIEEVIPIGTVPAGVALEDYKALKLTHLPLDTPEAELSPDETAVLTALFEFATADPATALRSIPTVTLDLTGWLRTSTGELSEKLFSVLFHIASSELCRVEKILVRGIRLTPSQEQLLAGLLSHQRARLLLE